jgi:tRNA-splicing ligase RtcB
LATFKLNKSNIEEQTWLGPDRRLSRHQAIKLSAGTDVWEKLKNNGILVFSFSNRGLQEEIPEAYKNIDDV